MCRFICSCSTLLLLEHSSLCIIMIHVTLIHTQMRLEWIPATNPSNSPEARAHTGLVAQAPPRPPSARLATDRVTSEPATWRRCLPRSRTPPRAAPAWRSCSRTLAPNHARDGDAHSIHAPFHDRAASTKRDPHHIPSLSVSIAKHALSPRTGWPVNTTAQGMRLPP
jgi:hypothetical protein